MLIAYTRSSGIFDDSRATKEIFAFLEKGDKVDVYGWDRNGGSMERCRALFKKYEDSISFSFYQGIPGKGTTKKIVSRYNWIKWLMKSLLSNNNIEVIHACDLDTGVIARKTAEKKHIKYIYDIFDYYVDAHPVPVFLKKYVEKEEVKVINDAAVTIICTENRKEQISKATPKRLAIIHNSPEVPEIVEADTTYDYSYCGSLNGGRLIKEILSLYPSNNDLKFAFAGSGMYAVDAKDLSIENDGFTYLGAITYDEVLDTESKSRVISAIYDPTKRNHRLCAPNKYYEALALAKPVIVCRGTGIDNAVSENNNGIVIGYDAKEFYDAIRYLKSNPDLCKEMGKRGRDVYEKEYSWTLMKKRLAAIYDDL